MLSYLSVSSTRRHQVWFLVGGDLGTGIGPYQLLVFSQFTKICRTYRWICCRNMTNQILLFLNFALGILDDFIGSSGVRTPDLQLTQKLWSLQWRVVGSPFGWYVVQLWEFLSISNAANFQQTSPQSLFLPFIAKMSPKSSQHHSYYTL